MKCVWCFYIDTDFWRNIAWSWRSSQNLSKTEIVWTADYGDCVVVWHWYCPLQISGNKPGYHCVSLLNVMHVHWLKMWTFASWQYSATCCQYDSIEVNWPGIYIFTNPSTRAGYDTRSIFKRSLTSLNSEFSFS